ncbi:uncharacterized protein KY384_007227 [Bacidia gigantensis]|uniref:uncharacterized protein n=1 Tax=Bacidia gigantensis TaxID=2732470 RepID=UPI001D04276A|nr:uncharacterized protein KY384_007227 [Bacidia gigantensis]KAG8528310.1 hypothetical protein KY384_007227 [Bacidia gigantensis]
MSIQSRVSELRFVVSADCTILQDSTDPEFREYCKRWTDIDRKIPAAIVLPRREKDIQNIVQWAVESSIPFVTKSGGCSEWSTIGDDGFIIDLTLYSSVEVNAEARTATIKGGVVQKEVALRLAEQGLFTALGNGNVVGVTGFALGGGSSITNSITGFGSDQIISARLVSAKGELLDITKVSQPDLLWAIRGAGHFFGLITEVVIKAYPLSLLGSENGTIWVGAFVFPLSRAEEVANAMKILMDDDHYATSGLMMVMAPPPTRTPSLVVSARYIGEPAKAKEAYAPLYGLKPLVANGSQVPIQNTSDGREAIGAKGDFKHFGIVGLRRFDSARFLQSIEKWKELVSECPDAINTAFNFQWDSRPVKKPDFESAMCLHDTRYWQ